MAKVNIPTLKLNSGHEIPMLGYGTFLGFSDEGQYNIADLPKMADTLRYAIDIGYRHVDTAHLYRVEAAIGDVVAEKVADGVVTRKEMFITTKLWNHMHAPADVEKSLRGSLERLRTDYVDLFLIHWPVSITVDGEDAGVDYLDTWRGMEAVLELGLARSIGVSNFNVKQLERLLANSKVTPAMNQVELSLNVANPELVQFCKKAGIAVTAYSPFGTMLPGRNPPGSPEPKLGHPLLVALSKKYGKSATQLVLRYLYQKGHVSIPKTITKERVLENASIFDFDLSAGDVASLDRFDVGYRTILQEHWQDHPYYPFEKQDIVTPRTPEFLLRWVD